MVEIEEVHIGKCIKAKLKEQGRTVTWFAKAIHTDRRNVYKIMNKSNLDLSLLIKISKVLNYNFLRIIADSINIEN